MMNPVHTTFAAVFKNEVLINSKRVAPYALMLLFAANAVLWWGWSVAAYYGWSVNNDLSLVRNFYGFAFVLGLPLFNALIMGDAVIRDFTFGIDQLIFSKPISRAEYLLGKFCGNFFVLVCCQSVFMLTSLVLQWMPKAGLVVMPPRVFPYFKHFFLIVVISHLLLAAIFFTVATLNRNVKFAYGAAVAFYPLYIASQIFLLKHLSTSWRAFLDPMIAGGNRIPDDKWTDAKWVDQLVITYSSPAIANRILVVLISAILLTILYFRFTITDRDTNTNDLATLNLAAAPAGAVVLPEFVDEQFPSLFSEGDLRRHNVSIPDVATINKGLSATLKKLFAATALELSLLRHERSLIVLVPLSMLVSFLSLPFSATAFQASPSAVFAGDTARGLLLFLSGVVVFYIGEAMHRDRELRLEPLLWSTPSDNIVFLLSKFMAVLSVSVLLLVVIGLIAILTQFLRGQSPIELSPYLIAYGVILIPSLTFMASASIALNVLLRDKYLCYALTIAVGSALFYLYSQGHNHWLYNPVMHGLWSDTDIASWSRVSSLIGLRVYALALAVACVLLGHFGFPRKSR